MAKSDDSAEIPALGRPFQLGMLYDCRKDTLIPGITLWDFDSLQKDLNVTPQPKTESEITASNSIEDKMLALNASASLKLSLLGGLIEVEGSARYLQDTKTSMQQARVTLQYKTTTKYKQLTMNHLGRENVSHPDVFDHGTATHVVTAILYGAQAFFVFDRQVSSSESVQEVEGNLQAVIKTVVSIAGKAAIELEEKEKSHIKNLSCKFHGDFALENNPVTFQDAMNVYANLPQMLGDHGEKAVPVRVWLYPLTKLDSRAAQLVREISMNLIFDTEALMEQLNEIMMKCHDLERDPIASTFPEIKRKIQRFKDLCKQHRQMFQKDLAGILPSIRGGGKEERVLVDLLMSINQSPFNSQRLNEFLDIKKSEFNHVESYLKILNGMEIVSSQNKLEEIVLDPKNTSVVSFTFTSLHDQEPFLSSLQMWLQKSFENEAPDCPRGHSPPEESKAWFEKKKTTQNVRKAARAIISFFKANQSNEGNQVVVSSVPDKDNPGASIYFYEGGDLVSSSFELPSKPLPPSVGRVGYDRVQLIFHPAEYGRGNISGYQVEYRIFGEENWEKVNTENNEEKFLLEGLRPNKGYQFQYAARSKPGLSETSDASGIVKTLPISPPGKPREVSVDSSTISVAWNSPKVIGEGVVINEYKVEWREEAGDGSQESQWKETRTKKKKELCDIDGLKPQMTYRFRISAVCVDGAQSEPSEEATISIFPEERKKQVVEKFLQGSTLVEDGPPPVYALPLMLSSDASGVIYQLGEENLQAPKKVILMMGATGSGKTTLINGIVNYILGVQWKDNFRFKLIHEVTKRSQAESQTSDMTAYILNHQKGFQIPYSLTIIDTPGFGDTRGIKYDKMLVEKIRAFFSTPGGIDCVDAVCFVVQAALARLTSTQKYIFDAVLSIFGKDIKDNILVLVTFADGQTPPVLEAIKEADVPCVKDASGAPVYFTFNNSALFANNAISGVGYLNFNEMFWKMGAQSMKTFLDSSSKQETRSLILTKEVLRERKELEGVLEALLPQIQVALVKLEEVRKTQEVLEQHKGDMEANRNFEYEVERTVEVNMDPFKILCNIFHRKTFNCMNCKMICYDLGSEKQFFFSFILFCLHLGNCGKCPGHCPGYQHSYDIPKFYNVVKEKRTYNDLKQKYEQASGRVMTTEKVLEKLSHEYAEVKDALEELIDSSSQILRRLQEIALKPNPLSTPEYIDLLIKGEEQELKPGYQERIQSLKEFRRRAEIIQKIEKKEPLLPEEQTVAVQVKQRKENIKSFFNRFK